MENLKKVSILLCTYNEPLDWIVGSIKSILDQTYSDIELIIIVDNPQNTTITDYLKLLTDKRIKYFINKKNIGLVASLNKGLKKCTGYYIARMDADDYAFQNRIQKQVYYLEHNNLDLVGCDFNFVANDKIIYTRTGGYKVDTLKEIIKYRNYIAHPTWLGKSAVFHTLNGYRNIDTCEDYDFILRAFKAGYRIANANSVLLNYRVNNNGISQSNWAKQVTITKILSDAYRKNRDISVNECYNLLNTEYQNIYKRNCNIRLYKEIINTSQNKFVKVLMKLKCICNSAFIQEYMVHALINYIVMRERNE